MKDETYVGWGSGEPDDLAAVVSASLHAAKVPHRIGFAIKDGKAHAIEVRHPDGRVIASMPIHPMKAIDLEPSMSMQIAAIEHLSLIVAAVINRARGASRRSSKRGASRPPRRR